MGILENPESCWLVVALVALVVALVALVVALVVVVAVVLVAVVPVASHTDLWCYMFL